MRRLFLVAAALAVVIAPSSIAAARADAPVTVIVEGCPVQVPAGANGIAVLDAAVASHCMVSYHTVSYSFGTFVDCIDEVCGASVLAAPDWPVNVGTYWAFYVNADSLPFGAAYGVDGYSAHDLDVLGFVYEGFAY